MIKSITLHDFQGHERSALDLAPGVNVIVGETDSGKTSIIRALKWLVTNKIGRLRSSADPVRRVAGKPVKTGVRVAVETDRGTVERVRKKGFNGYRIGGEEYKDLGGKIPGDLSLAIDLREINLAESFKTYYLVTDAPGQIARTISDTLGLGDADVAVSLARKAQEGLRGTLRDQAKAIAESDALIETLAFVDDLEPRVIGIEEQAEALEGERRSLDRLMDLISDAHLAAQEMREARKAAVDPADALAAYEVLEGVCQDRRRLAWLVADAAGAAAECQRWGAVRDSVELLLPAVEETLEELGAEYDRRTSLGGVVDVVRKSREYLDAVIMEVGLASKILALARDDYTETLMELGVCPYCGEKTSREHIEEALAS